MSRTWRQWNRLWEVWQGYRDGEEGNCQIWDLLAGGRTIMVNVGDRALVAEWCLVNVELRVERKRGERER